MSDRYDVITTLSNSAVGRIHADFLGVFHSSSYEVGNVRAQKMLAFFFFFKGIVKSSVMQWELGVNAPPHQKESELR